MSAADPEGLSPVHAAAAGFRAGFRIGQAINPVVQPWIGSALEAAFPIAIPVASVAAKGQNACPERDPKCGEYEKNVRDAKDQIGNKYRGIKWTRQSRHFAG